MSGASARLIRHASHRGPRPPDHGELTPLLSPDGGAHEDTYYATSGDESVRPHFHPNPFADLPVYQNIWRIRQDIIKNINDPYSLEQIRAPRLNTYVVRPMLEKLCALQDISIVFCLLVNRVQFLQAQSYHAHFQSVNTTRALVCEVLALRVMRQFDEESSGVKGLLLLANVVIAGFDPFQNAPPELCKRSRPFDWAKVDKGGYEGQITALEIAIISESKLFLSSAACQKVVDAIYAGRIVYTPTSFIDILPDHYKHKSISIYDPKKAPLMNQYRLIVPRVRNVIEVCQFILLLFFYVLVMSHQDATRFTVYEWIFCVYGSGWILDQLASMLGHGWLVYSHNLWSFLDVTFCIIYVVYLIVRIHGLRLGDEGTGRSALDILALGAPFLVPRLAFNIFSENILMVSARDMMSKFLLLMLLAIWSFAGFFLAMLWLSDGKYESVTIGKWMVWVWFGLDGTGVESSAEFHPLFGPLLMIAFAVFGNTLFLTIVVAALTSAFSNISRYEAAEVHFRRAVLTFEGVKGDAIFAYQPPFNILALCILLPMKLMVSPRWFHKINITAVRIINAPTLVLIAHYERRKLWPKTKKHARPPVRRRSGFHNFWKFRAHGDVRAVFKYPPPDVVVEQSRRTDSLGGIVHGGSFDDNLVPSTESESAKKNRSAEVRDMSPIPEIRMGEERVEGRISPPEDDEERKETSKASSRDEASSGDTEARLKRIEDMLGRVCESLDQAGEEDG